MLSDEPTIEVQISELEVAGWKQMRPKWIWKSPSGALYFGPNDAWKVMKKLGVSA